MVASYEGNVEMVQLLLQNGAEINHKNQNNEDALTLAQARGNTQVISVLQNYLGKKPLPNIPSSLNDKNANHIEAVKKLSNTSLNFLDDSRYESVGLPSTNNNNNRYNQFTAVSTGATLKRKYTQDPEQSQSTINARSNISRNRGDTLVKTSIGDNSKQQVFSAPEKTKWDSWRIFSRAMTCCIPNFALNYFGKLDANVKQAWREKITLCLMIFFISLLMAFITFLFSKLICIKRHLVIIDSEEMKQSVNIYGVAFSLQEYAKISKMSQEQVGEMGGQSANIYFPKDFSSCAVAVPESAKCTSLCQTFDDLQAMKAAGDVAYPWDTIKGNQNVFVFNGKVFDADKYLKRDGGFLGSQVNDLIQSVLGEDGSMRIVQDSAIFNAMPCFESIYLLGIVDISEPGCIISNLIVVISFVLLVGIILTKFISAVFFNWFISWQLGKVDKNNLPQTNVILFVTCYSEGEESIKRTLDSLAVTSYNDEKKLLFVVADGNVTGSGNAKSTPELILGLMRIAKYSRDPPCCSYISLGSGANRKNTAKVYAGYYSHQGRWVPMIAVIKTGNEWEAGKGKAGNRGKRDSQLILMNFLSRITMAERMCELDYDLFSKIKVLMGFYPDDFGLVLMVDADTEVSEDSLTKMVVCMERDHMIMGLCGETKISNKRTSWVTRIQVFEYYISHHLGKAFESVFGGVTCLPGCFCMYRIKVAASTKGPSANIIPILANPDIVEAYSENAVDTLHRKNLLLLGEDRYLSTLMLKAFPKRKMIFVPNAVCRTTVPDKFSILLSQRRRWINSTVHNLMELVLVRELCGIFCCSMQFVIFLELIGTVVLPASVIFLFYLFFDLIINGANANNSFSLAFMAAIMGLQAVLVLLTTRKLIYITWMLYYIVAIPIWNLVLPLYAFWHFDDFSWGQTRKTEGGGNDKSGHASLGKGSFDPSSVQMKFFHEFKENDILQAASVSTDDPAMNETPFQRQLSIVEDEELTRVNSSMKLLQ